MSIYSANRTGSMSIDTAAVAESYNMNDIGTILCECNTNDMAFFEAVLRCDFNEITGLREGTLLEAEAKKLNKESFKAAVNNIVQRLKRYWAKIKKVFDSAINKISAYIATNGKGFAKRFNKIYSKADWKGSVDHYVFELDDKIAMLKDGDMKMSIKNADSVDAKFVDKALAKMVNGGSDYSRKSFVADAISNSKKNITINSGNINDIIGNITNSGEAVKDLKTTQKSVKTEIESYVKYLTGNNQYEKSDLKIVNKRAEDMMAIINFVTKASIAVVRANVKASRTGLQKVLSDINHPDKVDHEFALIEAAETFDNFMDDNYSEFENEINTDEFED